MLTYLYWDYAPRIGMYSSFEVTLPCKLSTLSTANRPVYNNGKRRQGAALSKPMANDLSH